MRKVIGGFSMYDIDIEGNVISKEWRGRGGATKTRDLILTSGANKGYETVSLTADDGAKSMKQVHRLVCLAFLPNPEGKPFVNHINGIRNDNRLVNLEWCTSKENAQHASKVLNSMGKHFIGRIGKDCHNSVRVNQLTLDGILVKTWDSMMDVERTLGISNSQIAGVCKKKRGRKSAGGFKWQYVDTVSQ